MNPAHFQHSRPRCPRPRPEVRTAFIPTPSDGLTGTITLDSFGRTGELNWTGTSGAGVDDFQYTYDANSNVLSKRNTVTTTASELYAYDNQNRLTSFSHGTLNTDGTAITSPSTTSGWTLDGLGNWTNHTVGGTSVASASFNAQNQNNSLGYDSNGNQTTDASGRTLVYDAWNQLVAVNFGGTAIAGFAYDAMGRRASETEGGATTNLYYSTGWQVLEERQGGSMTAQNVWSPMYVDALTQRTVVSGGTTVYWAQHDDNFNTTSLTSNSGTVMASFVYDPYGTVYVLSNNTALSTGALFDTTRYLHQGLRFDSTTATYDSRNRIYDPTNGAWKQEDRGYWDGGNLYQFSRSNSVAGVDPSGQQDDTFVGIYGHYLEGSGTPLELSAEQIYYIHNLPDYNDEVSKIEKKLLDKLPTMPDVDGPTKTLKDNDIKIFPCLQGIHTTPGQVFGIGTLHLTYEVHYKPHSSSTDSNGKFTSTMSDASQLANDNNHMIIHWQMEKIFSFTGKSTKLGNLGNLPFKWILGDLAGGKDFKIWGEWVDEIDIPSKELCLLKSTTQPSRPAKQP